MVSVIDARLAEALSAVMDGEATAADWALVDAAWAKNPGLRERWVLWQAAADGLRAPASASPGCEPERLLASLHTELRANVPGPARRREWLAPLAVAAGFVALAVGVGTLRPAPAGGEHVATAAISTLRVQGLAGLSFAETAAGRTLPTEAPSEVVDWGLGLPEPAASAPRP